MGSATYGVSKILYAAEFSDLPSKQNCQQLQALVAKLVDRGQAPADASRKFTGVPARLLVGSPADGGFGVLAWYEHIIARHAWWGAFFSKASYDTGIPWVHIGRALLRSKCSWWGPLALYDCDKDTQTPVEGVDVPPPPLRRMICGLQALGSVSDVQVNAQQQQPPQQQQQQPPGPTSGPVSLAQLRQQMEELVVAPVLTPGPWCALAPVFCNPFLPAIPGAVPGGLQVLSVPPARGDFYYRGGRVRHVVRTLGDFFRAWYVIQGVVRNQLPHPLVACSSSNAEGDLDDLNSLTAHLPPAWISAVLRHVQAAGWPPAALPAADTQPSEEEHLVENMLVCRLGWYLLPAGKPCSILRLSVKTATALQLSALRVEQRDRRRQFACLCPRY
jgi:hypothetical protein